MELKHLSLLEIQEWIQNKTFSQKEVQSYFFDRIKKYNPTIDAFNSIAEESLQDDSLFFAGIPLGVKDVFCEKGVTTTASSKMLENFKPPYESTVTTRLKNAGFVSAGKLNLDEFAMGGSGENSALRITKNPWDISRIPGGSSSGSAAAVAAGLVPAALGTDTGGSIRQPAFMCGIVGFKPTYGRNSRYGVIAMASSLDTPGTFTKTVRDAAALYELTAGYDKHDSTSLDIPVSVDKSIWGKQDLKGIKIGVPKEYITDGIEKGVSDAFNKALETYKTLGAEIQEISLPHTQYGLAVYYIIMPAEVSTNLARYNGIRFGHTTSEILAPQDMVQLSRAEGFGKEAIRRSMLGAFVLSAGFYDAYYKKANQVRQLISQDFTNAFEKVDVIITPTSPEVAWKIGEKSEDPLKMYLSDIFTVNGSLAGLPGLNIPCGFAKPSDGEDIELPVGIQILAPQLGEEKAFLVGHVFEQAMKDTLKDKHPAIF